ncbi:MAG: hypothetical protein OEW89_10325 [Gammaproteobacteria bacterium]|nr:hypothetical protein [Gammaproteobacteria bacterium]MDH5593513.1 hypothetical protein [Gammaproteobacteria bacterium]MDH5614583.1 hypothetical protein [Gammaproteobacteria bacterium]
MVSKKHALLVHRIIWMIVFFAGAILLLVTEWNDQSANAVGWFLATGIWSAICGIGFSVGEWFMHRIGQ